MLKASLTALAFAGFLAAAPSFAASTAPKVPAAPAAAAPAAPAAPAATDDMKKKMKSKECSAQADKKGLHGKERKKFREECKKAA
jgi:psiF repeat